MNRKQLKAEMSLHSELPVVVMMIDDVDHYPVIMTHESL